MTDDGRNTLPGIAQRVQKNLAFITSARNMGADVHVVTQLLLSLLGLVIFPYEELRRQNRYALSEISLHELQSEGWPNWNFTISKSDSLGDLLFHVRNAISHRRLFFSSDSRALEDVEITFRDRKTSQAPDDWAAQIPAKDLQLFVDLLSEFLADRSYSP